MGNSQTVITRLFELLFVPAMYLFPLVFVLMSRRTVESEADRALARGRAFALGLATLGALAVHAWVRVAFPAVPLVAVSLTFWFPLWFGFAMPALHARNPNWGKVAGGSGVVRTASLVSRRRKSPLGRGHWTLLVGVYVAILAVLAVRGIAEPFADDDDRRRWLGFTSAFALLALLELATLPFALRMALAEPEPLDAEGSAELTSLYDAHRDAKIRGLFWLLGVGLPLVLGAPMVIATWTNAGEVAGILGGVGGSLVGIAGAWFGIAMSIRRVRIAEVKTQLEAKGQSPTRT